MGEESGGVGCGHVCSQCRVKSFYVLLAVKANGKEQASGSSRAQVGIIWLWLLSQKCDAGFENPKQIVWRYTVSLY